MATDADLVLRAQGDASDGIPTLTVKEGFCEGLEDVYSDARRRLYGTHRVIAVVVLVK